MRASDDAGVLSSTGVPLTTTDDSVLVSYEDLRIANAKMTELKYEKEINENYRTIIRNDSISISSLNFRIESLNQEHNKEIKKVKKERNYFIGSTIVSVLVLIISIL